VNIFPDRVDDEWWSKEPIVPVAEVSLSLPDLWKTTVLPQEIADLAPYMVVAQNLTNASEATAPSMLSQLSAGLIRVGTLLAAARHSADIAKAKRKQYEAKLALEEFPNWCTANNIKPTEAQRSAFVDLHAVSDESKEEAFYGAMVTHLDIMKTTLIMAISSARAIVYGHKDSHSVTGNRV
jgi:hypothetical protein